MMPLSGFCADTEFECDPLELRYQLNWSLERLAQEMGVSLSTTLKWSSRVSSPTRMARRLAYYIKQAQ